MPITHAFVSGKTDGADATQVQPSNWNANHVVTSYLDYPEAATPTAPAAGTVRLFSKDFYGYPFMCYITDAGEEVVLAPRPDTNLIAYAIPASGTTITQVGTALTTSGTVSTTQMATTSVLTRQARIRLASSATAGNVTYARCANLFLVRGAAAGTGGFYYRMLVALSALQTGNRGFWGIADSTANPTNVDPTTSTTAGKMGLAINANTGNWNFITNVSGTAPTVTGLGANFPVNVTDLLELTITCPPNGTTVTWQVNNLTSSTSTSGTVTTNYPVNTQYLAPYLWFTNNAQAAAVSFEWLWYAEALH